MLPWVALAHSRGVHKKDVVTVRRGGLEVLVTLDFDAGKRARLLRAGADADRDGLLGEAEREALRSKLARLAVGSLQVSVSGHRLKLAVQSSKLSLREDGRASGEGLSVAVLLAGSWPGAPIPGMTLVVKDETPDRSHLAVEVYQAVEGDGGAVEPTVSELLSGAQVTVRLGQLAF